MRNLLLIVLLTCIIAGTACAQTAIPLVNGSFEDPSVAPAAYIAGGVPTGWNFSDYNAGWEAIVTDVGAYCKGGGVHLLPQDGSQAMAMYSPSSMIMHLYQNTGVQIQSGISYTASASVVYGYAARVGLGYADTPTGEYNGVKLAESVMTPTTSWQQLSVTGSLAADDPNVGKYLVVYVRAFGWTGFDNVTLSYVNNNTSNISGSIDLADYAGDLTLCPIRIDLIRPAGSDTVVATQVVKPVADAENPIPYTLEAVSGGTYDVRFTATQWLRKSLKNFVVEPGVNQTGIDVILTNGDTDGDNEITSSDLSVGLKSLNISGD